MSPSCRWGACNAYLVIVGDVFSSLGRFVAGPESVFADRQIIIASIGVAFLLPLCFIRRIGALSALSSVAVVGFLYTSAVVLRNAFIVMAKREAEGLSPFDGVELLRLDYGALFALPIVVFGFNCHANAVRGTPEQVNPCRWSILSIAACLQIHARVGNPQHTT